jgi:hypothetical protein
MPENTAVQDAEFTDVQDGDTDVVNREDMQVPAVLPESPPPPPKKRKQHEKEFTDAVVVRRIDKSELLVPLTAEGARNANLITAEMARDLVEKTIQIHMDKDTPPTPKELADLTAAAKNVAEMAMKAHGAAANPSAAPEGSSLTAIYHSGDTKTPTDFLALVARLDGAARQTKNVTPAK